MGIAMRDASHCLKEKLIRMKSLLSFVILISSFCLGRCAYANENNSFMLESWRVEAIEEGQQGHLFSLNAESSELLFSFHLAESNERDEGLREIFLVSEQHDWWGCLVFTTNGLENVALSTLSSNKFTRCLKDFSFCMNNEKSKVNFNINQHIVPTTLFAAVSLGNKQLFKVIEGPTIQTRTTGKLSQHRCLFIPLCQSKTAMLINSADKGKYYDVACICDGDEQYTEAGYMKTDSGDWKRYESQIAPNGIITSTLDENRNSKSLIQHAPRTICGETATNATDVSRRCGARHATNISWQVSDNGEQRQE